MKTIGWVKLHRSFLDWEHYSNKNVSRVFLHLLLTAAYEDTTIRGIELKKGQILISERKLASKLGVSRKVARNAIKKLIQTGELSISRRIYKVGFVYSIVNFGKYQSGAIETTENQVVLRENPQPNNASKEGPKRVPKKGTQMVPKDEPQMVPKKISETENKPGSYSRNLGQEEPKMSPQMAPKDEPQTVPKEEPLYNKNTKNNKNNKNFNNSNIDEASDSKSEAKRVIEEITKTLTSHSDARKEKKRKVAAKEKKRGTLIAKAEKKPITPENRYHNAAIEFWKLLRPVHGENYVFKNAKLEKWAEDLRVLENSRGYKLEKVFDAIQWVMEEGDNSIDYIQSPSFFLKEKSKNIAILLARKKYWQRNIDKRNGILRKIPAPTNVIRAPED